MALAYSAFQECFLLDSNYVIGILNGTIPVPHSDTTSIAISVVTVMELYALAGMSDSEQRRIDTALKHLDIFPITMAIAIRAGILSRTRRRGKADLLIAATALEYSATLVTKNIKDFTSLPHLKVVSTI
ncbi:MAG: PIN domain-containing protein [Patescibacteria group bacterium]